MDKQEKVMYQTTPEDFEAFKESFFYWQKELGLTQYEAYFKVMDLGGDFGGLNVDQMGKVASLSFPIEVAEDRKQDLKPVDTGKHECFHLLLSRLRWLGEARWIENNDLVEEDEAIVRRLEKVLKREDKNENC